MNRRNILKRMMKTLLGTIVYLKAKPLLARSASALSSNEESIAKSAPSGKMYFVSDNIVQELLEHTTIQLDSYSTPFSIVFVSDASIVDLGDTAGIVLLQSRVSKYKTSSKVFLTKILGEVKKTGSVSFNAYQNFHTGVRIATNAYSILLGRLHTEIKVKGNHVRTNDHFPNNFLFEEGRTKVDNVERAATFLRFGHGTKRNLVRYSSGRFRNPDLESVYIKIVPINCYMTNRTVLLSFKK